MDAFDSNNSRVEPTQESTDDERITGSDDSPHSTYVARMSFRIRRVSNSFNDRQRRGIDDPTEYDDSIEDQSPDTGESISKLREFFLIMAPPAENAARLERINRFPGGTSWVSTLLD